MKKKNIIFLLTFSVLLLGGCSGGRKESDVSAESAPLIEEVTSLPDAEIIIPSALVGNEITEAAANDSTTAAPEESSEAADNTKTLTLSGEERTAIVNEIAAELSASIAAILENDDYYPDIVSITPNEDATMFTIALKDGVMNQYESMLAMSFYMVGNKYQIYAGVPADEAKTVVVYINDDTGEIISETDSSSLNTFTGTAN